MDAVRPKTVMVVDDNEDVAQIAAAYLTKHGYNVVLAGDGTRALELAVKQRPDCILLDLMMPNVSGLEVLSQLKANPSTAPIPVILVTAKSGDEDVLSGYKEGADYYITKPFSAQQLVYGIRLVLGMSVPDSAPSVRD